MPATLGEQRLVGLRGVVDVGLGVADLDVEEFLDQIGRVHPHGVVVGEQYADLHADAIAENAPEWGVVHIVAGEESDVILEYEWRGDFDEEPEIIWLALDALESLPTLDKHIDKRDIIPIAIPRISYSPGIGEIFFRLKRCPLRDAKRLKQLGFKLTHGRSRDRRLES